MHHEHAAKHHNEAAKAHEAGNHEKGSHHAQVAYPSVQVHSQSNNIVN